MAAVIVTVLKQGLPGPPGPQGPSGGPFVWRFSGICNTDPAPHYFADGGAINPGVGLALNPPAYPIVTRTTVTKLGVNLIDFLPVGVTIRVRLVRNGIAALGYEVVYGPNATPWDPAGSGYRYVAPASPVVFEEGDTLDLQAVTTGPTAAVGWSISASLLGDVSIG